jgi:hypothetical protein
MRMRIGTSVRSLRGCTAATLGPSPYTAAASSQTSRRSRSSISTAAANCSPPPAKIHGRRLVAGASCTPGRISSRPAATSPPASPQQVNRSFAWFAPSRAARMGLRRPVSSARSLVLPAVLGAVTTGGLLKGERRLASENARPSPATRLGVHLRSTRGEPLARAVLLPAGRAGPAFRAGLHRFARRSGRRL